MVVSADLILRYPLSRYRAYLSRLCWLALEELGVSAELLQHNRELAH
jgi:hypothetical protein